MMHHGAGVRLGVVRLVQPVPGQVGAGQGRLDQVLGQLLVAGQRVRRPQQGGPAGPDERGKVVGHGIPLVACPANTGLRHQDA